jgi:hypothetical protein
MDIVVHYLIKCVFYQPPFFTGAAKKKAEEKERTSPINVKLIICNDKIEP